MCEFKKQDAEFERKYFKNKYNPQAKKAGGRGNGKKD